MFQNKRNYKPSYNHCPSAVPFVYETIGNFIDKAKQLHGNREAIVDCQQGIRKTFQQQCHDIDEFAAGLLALNLNIGDRIGVWSINRYEWTIAAYAAFKAGLILVPLNPAYQPREVDYCLRKLQMRAMIAHDQFRTQDYYKIMCSVIPEIRQTKIGDQIKSQTHPYFDTLILMTDQHLPGVIRFNDVYKAATIEHKDKLIKIQLDIEVEKPALIMFTSGTTGQPKAAMMSHFTLVNNIYQGASRFKSKEASQKNKQLRSCLPTPLFHAFGFHIMVSAMGNGYPIVLPSMTFNAAATIKAIQDEKCTGFGGTATMFVDIMNHPDIKSADLSSLERVVMGGSLCPAPLLKRISEELKLKTIMTAYGATETTSAVTSTLVQESLEGVFHTCGQPIDNNEIKIVDENGKIVPRGCKGQVCTRGYKTMMGYWGDKEKTSQVLSPDGWYYTGDIGIMLENGNLQIVDRIKDMIIRGGENIYPKEIEDLLMEHPKISEAYVIGVPDERLNEEVCVWIQCHSQQMMSESEVKEFCKGKISYFKIPRYVRFVNNFPKTLSGKVQKFLMREEEAKSTKNRFKSSL
ncbi:hypothetical protein CHUAL_013184 [Chamberlinius hualienensis]